MKFKKKFLIGKFINRPNRFITTVKIHNKIVSSHLPDPGRLKELLIPGAKILLTKESDPKRKTQFTTQGVYKNNILISLNTLLPNKFVHYLIKNNSLNFLKGWDLIKKEASIGNHRFDFLLKNKSDQMYLEVKSVTFVENGIAKFPDAITIRGRQHLEHLRILAQSGYKALVLFVVQRPDAKLFKPEWIRDPKFSLSLYNAWISGVTIKVITTKFTKKEFILKGTIPFELHPPQVEF
tara:strand:- start:12 stop:722 length:711 start_codon:yes stop_codon:yes gene_type:complete